MSLDADTLAQLAALAGDTTADKPTPQADEDDSPSVADRVLATVRAAVGRDDVTPQMTLEDQLDMDKLMLWSVITTIEDDEKITFLDQDVNACQTVSDVIDMTQQKIS